MAQAVPTLKWGNFLPNRLLNKEEHMKTLKYVSAAAALSVLSAMSVMPAQAEYPERKITLYIIHKQGGGTDSHFRAFVPFFEKHLGGKIAAVNKPGGGGSKGLTAAVKSKNDGYTLVTTNLPALVSTQVARKVKYTTDSFDYVGAINVDPTALYTHPDSKYKTVKDVIADAKANPGKVTLGVGSFRNHGITALRFEKALGVDFNMVSLGGGGPLRKAVLGKHVPMGFQGMGAVAKYHPKKIRILTQFSPVRRSHGASVPTIKEAAGLEIYHNVVRNIGLPAGVDKKILAKLRAAHKKAMEDPAWHKLAKKNKIPVAYITGPDVKKMAGEMKADLLQTFKDIPDLKKLMKKKKTKKKSN
jgi:tripartite-type tricarboxylate transporter receptor subunit TctC